MIEKDNLNKTSAWPFVEAKKLLRERKSFIEKKGKIILLFLAIKDFLSRSNFLASTKGHALVLFKLSFSITFIITNILYLAFLLILIELKFIYHKIMFFQNV